MRQRAIPGSPSGIGQKHVGPYGIVDTDARESQCKNLSERSTGAFRLKPESLRLPRLFFDKIHRDLERICAGSLRVKGNGIKAEKRLKNNCLRFSH